MSVIFIHMHIVLSYRAPMLAVFSPYQEITAEIIGVCETVASIVSPVVCNSSPEGFLPEAASQPESSQVSNTENEDMLRERYV